MRDSLAIHKNKFFFIGLLFYFYQYLIRLLPGVMIDELVGQFHISPKEFSDFGSLYLYAYSILQIPFGILLDKYDIKKIFLVSIFLCVFGTALFALSSNIILLKFARILQGIGSAPAFIGTIKIVADSFSEGNRGLFTGLSLAVGVAGALFCGIPMNYFLSVFGMKIAIFIVSLFGVALFFITYFTKSNKTSRDNVLSDEHSTNSIFTIIPRIFKKTGLLFNKNLLIYSILATGLYAPIAVFSDLWGTGFLILKFGFMRDIAAQSATIVYMGLFFGSIILPKICENFIVQSLRCILLFLFFVFAMIIFYDNVHIIKTLLFSMGFLAGAEMLCFTGGVIGSNEKDSGIRIGILNTLNMLLSGVLQQIIGVILGKRVPSGNIVNFAFYKYQDFAISFITVLVLIFICFVISVKIKVKN